MCSPRMREYWIEVTGQASKAAIGHGWMSMQFGALDVPLNRMLRWSLVCLSALKCSRTSGQKKSWMGVERCERDFEAEAESASQSRPVPHFVIIILISIHPPRSSNFPNRPQNSPNTDPRKHTKSAESSTCIYILTCPSALHPPFPRLKRAAQSAIILI
jgi:hypothetical protein